MSQLEPRIEAIRKKYELSQTDFWQIKQNGQWVCKHAALEVVATKAGIEWMEPKIIEANAPGLVTSMVVTGKLDGRIEWATGETNPTNYSVTGKQPAYPWAMSEKRAKDRVILKLSGVHGLLYSDAEVDASETRSEAHADPSEPLDDAVAKLLFPVIQDALRAATTDKQLDGAWSKYLPLMSSFSPSMQETCDASLTEMRQYLAEHNGDARGTSRDVIEADLRAAISMDDLKSKWIGWGDAMRKLGKDDVLMLSQAKEQVKKSIEQMGGKLPDFANLTKEQEHAIAVANTP